MSVGAPKGVNPGPSGGILEGIGDLLHRVILGTMIALAVIILVVPLMLLLVLNWFEPDVAYDRDHPDFQRYQTAFAALGRQFDGREPTRDDVIDLAPLNGGDWSRACIYGGYNQPGEQFAPERTSVEDRERLERARSLLRIDEVAEFEMLIAYLPADGRARFIHFPQGFGSQGQHFERCVEKPDTLVRIGRD